MQTYQPTPELKIAEDVYKTPLEGLYFLPHHAFADHRGFYAEIARIPEVEAITGRAFVAKQVNLSHSETNVIRGFHAEAWDKLITVVTGKVMSVLVDIRPESPTFGQHVKFLLGSGEGALAGALFVSQGIANGFVVLEGPADYVYLVDELYANRDKAGDKAINLFDTDLNIEWPISHEQLIISERDANSVSLRQLYPEKFVGK